MSKQKPETPQHHERDINEPPRNQYEIEVVVNNYDRTEVYYVQARDAKHADQVCMDIATNGYVGTEVVEIDGLNYMRQFYIPAHRIDLIHFVGPLLIDQTPPPA